ncbi:methylated-DNA--[protein]-cysteine S-methyltransferase [Pseudomonas purpurea]|uniref:methylated-DNA--[protein]-cysteine S-methyltransferase n=1 Tax=Pseudomonas purpurea TaxID=3136737 RepID=UPI003264CA86
MSTLPSPAVSCIRYLSTRFSLGVALAAYSDAGLCALLLGDEPTSLESDLRRRFAQNRQLLRDDNLAIALQHVVHFLDTPHRPLSVPLDLVTGSEFQRRVWQALQHIPLGETRTYRDIARQLGQPGAFRAVANACGANPLAVVIPCHRVVRQDGGLGGYRWGLERKHVLLEREARR